MIMSVLYLILFNAIFMGIGYNFMLASLLIQRPIVVMLTSSIRQCSFFLYDGPNGYGSLTDSST
jgi:hypothetical protein